MIVSLLLRVGGIPGMVEDSLATFEGWGVPVIVEDSLATFESLGDSCHIG